MESPRLKLRLNSLIVLTVLLASSPAFTFTVTHDPQTGQGILRANTCQELQPLFMDLKQWLESNNEIYTGPLLDCNQNSHQTTLDLTPFIPSHIQNLYSLYPKCTGFNCLDAALIERRFHKNPRHTSGGEWKNYLRHYCTPRKQGEAPSLGDLGAIQELQLDSHKNIVGMTEIHGFTAIGQKLAFSKNGQYEDSAAEIAPLEDVLRIYGIANKPNCINLPIPDKACPRSLTYFSCKAPTDFLYGKPTLHLIDMALSQCVTTGNLQTLGGIGQLLNTVKKTIQWSEGIKKPLSLLYTTVDSYHTQMRHLTFIDLYKNLDKRIASCSPKKLNEQNPDQETLLLYATMEGDLNKVDLLVQNKVDLDLANASGLTPLMKAIDHKHSKIVETLLQGGVDPNLPDKSGWTPLIFAADNGYFKGIQLLIHSKANVNLPDLAGWTPLQSAVNRGYLAIAKFLILHKANVNRSNNEGWTPLHTAASNGDMDIVKELMAHGANLNPLNKDGMTPLALALAQGHYDIVKELLAAGANPNIPNRLGWSPLERTAHSGDLIALRLLIDAHVPLEGINNPQGFTALALAVRNGHVDTVKVLLDAGANPTALSKKGQTVLYLTNHPKKVTSQELFDLIDQAKRKWKKFQKE